jgi:hypothetical protein
LSREGRLFVIDFGKSKAIDFHDDKEDQRKSDKYVAELDIKKFFEGIDKISI